MLWIYITIAVSIILVFAVRLTLKSMEHLSQQQNGLTSSTQISLLKSAVEPVLNEPVRIIEYNRNNIPVDVRNKLSDLLYKRLLLKTKNPILPNGFEFVKIQQDNEKSLWTVEAFINTSGCFQVGKIVWEFWLFHGSADGYQLKSVRPYSFQDGNSHLIPKVHGIQKNAVISKDNLTNPYINNLQAGLSREDATNLEMTAIEGDLQSEIDTRQGRQPWATVYNRWILPKGIQRYDVFATFTPDIINNNLYRTGKFDDLFSRTRHDPSFPHGTATGGR